MRSRFRSIFAAALIGLAVGWLVDPFLSPPDAAAYFSWGWSLVRDADFSFTNEFAVFNFPIYCVYLSPAERVANDWPLGSGLAWAPALAVADLLQRAIDLLGKSATSAYSPPRFQRLVAPSPLVVSVAIAWTTLLTLWVFERARRRAAEWFGVPAAGVGAWATVLGTPFFFYLLFGPFFSHGLSFATTGAFLLVWERRRGRWSAPSAFTAGVLAGWMGCVRPQSFLYLLVIPIEALVRRIRGVGGGGPRLQTQSGPASAQTDQSEWPDPSDQSDRSDKSDCSPHCVSAVLAAAAGLLLGFLPQMIAWKCLYGSFLALPKMEEMDWLRPHIASLLFSDFHGVLPWTPALAFAAGGLLLLARRDLSLGLALGAAVAAQIYVNAANEIWWGSGSFGNRRLLDASAIALWSFAAWWAWAAGGKQNSGQEGGQDGGQDGGRRCRKTIRWLAAAALGAACLWTLALAGAERLGALTLDHYVPFNRSFFASMALLPGRAGELIGYFLGERGLSWGYRALIAALVAGGWWAIRNQCRFSGAPRLSKPALEPIRKPPVAWTSRPRFSFVFLERLLSAASGGALTAGGIACAACIVCAIAAWRTPPFQSSWIDGFQAPRENSSLWGNRLEQGHYLLEHGRAAEALDAFRRAETLRPLDATARRWQGVALGHLSRWEEGARLFTELMETDPSDTATLREALTMASRWAEASPAAPQPWTAAARWYELARRPEDAARARAEAQRRLAQSRPLPPAPPH